MEEFSIEWPESQLTENTALLKGVVIQNVPYSLYNGVTAMWVVRWTRMISFRAVFVNSVSNKAICSVSYFIVLTGWLTPGLLCTLKNGTGIENELRVMPSLWHCILSIVDPPRTLDDITPIYSTLVWRGLPAYDVRLSSTWRFGSYCIENLVLVRYTDKSVNAVWDIASIYCESILNTQITQCGKMQEFLNAAVSSLYMLPPGFKMVP